MSHRKETLDADVLAVLTEARYPLSLHELAQRLKLRGSQHKELKKALKRLQAAKQVVGVASSRYLLAERHRPRTKPRVPPPLPTDHAARIAGHEIHGRLVCHRDGYGFVIPEQAIPGIEGDIFIPPNALADAMHGDRVRVQLASRRRRRGGIEGRVVAVLDRAHQTLVGQFHYAQPQNYVIPYDHRIRQHILIPSSEELPKHQPALEGAIVNVELTRFPSAAGALPGGRIVEVLGWAGEFGVDVALVIRRYHLPDKFPPEVAHAAALIPQAIAPAARAAREDFRQLPVVTIDGEDAKDFDDAVYVAPLPDGHWQLHVHIADVSHYVHPGTALDREARLRGTSVYFPDRALPMLPLELSHGICSLNPVVDRLVLSVLMEIDSAGEVVRYRFPAGVIRSAARMTYTEVNAILEGDAGLRRRYAALVPEFEKMRELALILNAKRQRRGSLDFDLPEPVIRFDPHGQMIGIAQSERNIAHRIIEEFMLAANETVASFLAVQGVASLYRVHERPDPRKVLEFEELAAAFGYSLGIKVKRLHKLRLGERRRDARRHHRRQRSIEVPEHLDISPRHYQQLSEKLAGKPEERILSYLMLRSLKQARYSEQNLGHFALAIPPGRAYTHFTSPIRRYPDLIVHRLLKWTLRRRATKTPLGKAAQHPPDQGPLKLAELAAIAAESSEAERRADDAERELMNLKKLDFMAQHLGDEFDALVIGTGKAGFWVELLEPDYSGVEGFVPSESLDPALRYLYEAQTRTLAPRRQHRQATPRAPAYHLGDRVRVRVDRIDRMLNNIQFSVVAHLGRATGGGA